MPLLRGTRPFTEPDEDAAELMVDFSEVQRQKEEEGVRVVSIVEQSGCSGRGRRRGQRSRPNTRVTLPFQTITVPRCLLPFRHLPPYPDPDVGLIFFAKPHLSQFQNIDGISDRVKTSPKVSGNGSMQTK